MMIRMPLVHRVAVAAMVFGLVTALAAQTVIKPPKNKYKPEEDVKLGLEAAAEVRKQYPVISDPKIASYLTKLGDRLVDAAPPDLNLKIYQYSFTPVNVKEINAFALPGGPMVRNRSAISSWASRLSIARRSAGSPAHAWSRNAARTAGSRSSAASHRCAI